MHQKSTVKQITHIKREKRSTSEESIHEDDIWYTDMSKVSSVTVMVSHHRNTN